MPVRDLLAYTAACRQTTDGRLAKILRGHSSGMEDKYVLRNPELEVTVGKVYYYDRGSQLQSGERIAPWVQRSEA